MHGLEKELGHRAQVIRLNVDEPPGQRARERYSFQKVPTIIVLNSSGDEVYRSEGKLPRKQQIREALA